MYHVVALLFSFRKVQTANSISQEKESCVFEGITAHVFTGWLGSTETASALNKVLRNVTWQPGLLLKS